MKTNLWEMHAHTSEVSPCGSVSARELAESYISQGYSGVIITDHFSYYGQQKAPEGDWNTWVDFFCSGWRAAKEAAAGRLQVLFGAELCLTENSNDYLLYGVTESFLRAHPELLQLPLREVRRLADENGILIYQAHPFRNGMTVMDPRLLDGVEIYNGNKRHDSRNEIAAAWAARFGLGTVSGSDFHEQEDLARGGILIDADVRTMQEMQRVLQSGALEIRRTP